MKPMATQRGSSCRVSASISAVSQSKASMAAKSTPCLTRLACRFVSSHSNRAPQSRHIVATIWGAGQLSFPTRGVRCDATAIRQCLRVQTARCHPRRRCEPGRFARWRCQRTSTSADGRFPQCTSFSPGRPEIHDYFHSLRIPPTPTLYDHLLLALRKKDVVATFNWDPLLLQAAKRCIEGGVGRERSWRNEPGRDHRHSGRNGAQILLA